MQYTVYRRRTYSASRIIHREFLHLAFLLFTVYCLLFTNYAFAEDLNLQSLIDEALLNNYEVLTAESEWKGLSYRIPQAKTLPDPMFMVQYQNESWNEYTFGEMEGSQWMFSAAQMLPFPGKLSLKAEMIRKETESREANYSNVKLQVVNRIKTAYYDLYFNHKASEFLNERRSILDKIESSALSRYSTGMAPQQEVLMAQIEKSMLIEKEEMLKQKVKSIEAEINMLLGRAVETPLGKPSEISPTVFLYSFGELREKALSHSSELRMKEKMIKAGELGLEMAKKEYYPDFNLIASVAKRKGEFEDMWSLGIGINIPLFYRTKQRMGVLEQNAALSQRKHDFEQMRQTISFEIKDNLLMAGTAERLAGLYKDTLIPQADMAFRVSMSEYATGKVEITSLLKNLNLLLDNKLQYHAQLIEREKAIARLEVLTGKEMTEAQK